MREAMVREWPLLAGEEKAGLRQYLLHYLTRRLYLTTYVQKQVLYALALLVKRASLEPGFAELFRSVLDSVAQLLATGEVKVVSIPSEYYNDFYLVIVMKILGLLSPTF